MVNQWKCFCGETWEGYRFAIAYSSCGISSNGYWIAKHNMVKTCPSCEPHISNQEGKDWSYVTDLESLRKPV